MPRLLGNPVALQAGFFSIIGWGFLLTLIGWIGGGLYFRSVASIAMDNNEEVSVGLFRALAQTIMLSITFTILSLVVGFPIVLILSLVLQLNEFLANILVLVLSLASMWLIVPLFFWPHGVFVKEAELHYVGHYQYSNGTVYFADQQYVRSGCVFIDGGP